MSSPDPLDLFADSDSVEDETRVTTPPRAEREMDDKYVEDSPGKQRSTHTRSYQKGDLNDMCHAILQDIGEFVPEIGLDEFTERFLPPLRDDFDIPKIVELLNQHSLVSSSEGVLKDFEEEPRKQKQWEDIVLAPLSKICEDICYLASQSTNAIEPDYFLAMVPNHAPYLEISMKHRPDGTFLHKSKKEFAALAAAVKGKSKQERVQREQAMMRLKREGKDYNMYDLAVPFEGKKKLKGQNDNAIKMFFHGQQLMAYDPCRRFVLGITTENTDMRLWFFSRGTPVVSATFNFTRDIERLTQVILSLSFASREQLGWDPTIQPARTRNSDHQYIIEVNGRKYKTSKIIADIKAHALLSSGTRVWKATDVGTMESVILKDAWMEDDRSPERHIYDMILGDVQQKYGMLARRKVASGLLTPIEDWLVQVDQKTDHTADIRDNSFMIKPFALTVDKAKSGGSGSRRGVGPPGSHDSNEIHEIRSSASLIAQMKRFPVRRHYRVVFAETGTPLYTVKTLSDTFRVLRESAESLKLIHGCNWVHRDISAGNIYLFNDRGLLGDLEYARRKDSKTVAHDMRTGSIDYMASEAIKHKYLFLNTRRVFQRGVSRPPPPFVHNELHDLESLWWTAIYVIFFMLDTGFETGRLAEPEMRARSQKREATRQVLFPGSNETTRRESFLSEQHTFLNGVSWIPNGLVRIPQALDEAREQLVQCYVEYEASFEATVVTKAHDALISCFKLCEIVSVTVQQVSGSPLVNMESFGRLHASKASPDVAGGHNLPGQAETNCSGGLPRKRKRKDKESAYMNRSRPHRRSE